MKLAYLIIIHKNIDQVFLLLDSIYDINNLYLIHVDKKCGNSFFESVKDRIRKEFPSQNNIFCMRKFRCNWGSFSLVKVHIEGIRHLLDINYKWNYLINLSGQDFPIKSQKYIVDFLKKHEDKNFIEVLDQKEWPLSLNRLKRYYIGTRSGVINTRIKRKLPRKFKIFGGATWFILNRKFCEFIIYSKISIKIINHYRYAFVPDELVFQTLIMNSDFKDSVVNDNQRIVSWGHKKAHHPNIIKTDDYEMLKKSDKLFARKFDMNEDSNILFQMRELITKEHSIDV